LLDADGGTKPSELWFGCESTRRGLVNVGSYPGSPSPYGTFDQGGNVWEWNEAMINAPIPNLRGIRGAGFANDPSYLAASLRDSAGPRGSSAVLGFRLALIPEPSTGLLVVAGLLGLAGWRRVRA
jgi:hypothetical protein